MINREIRNTIWKHKNNAKTIIIILDDETLEYLTKRKYAKIWWDQKGRLIRGHVFVNGKKKEIIAVSLKYTPKP